MKLFFLVILLLAVAAFGRNLPKTAAESPSLVLRNNNMEHLEQETIMQATQTKKINKSYEVRSQNEVVLPPLPQREGPRPKTTGAVPHQQIDVEVVPDLNASLYSWVASLPDIEMQNSIASLPGATGIWLKSGTAIAQPQVILAGREFTHIHPDGSLHTPLPIERAIEAVEMGWAEPHPWAKQRAGWEGLVMLYTPQSEADLEIVFQLIVESYNFVTGQAEVSTDYTSE